MPFPANVVRPDPILPVWTRKPRRGRVYDLSGALEPAAVPVLTDAEAALPVAVGHLFDRTILASDALRSLADLWCRHAKTCLLHIGGVVRPLLHS